MNVILSVVLALAFAPQSEELKGVIERYESSKNLRIENRIPTILAFGRVKEPEAVRYVEKIFREEILPEAREAALQALIQMETAPAADFLIRIGAQRKYDAMIVKGLGAATTAEARNLVYARAKGKGAGTIDERLVAIEVIALYGDDRAKEALLGFVKDRRQEVRAEAARGLPRFEGEEVLTVLTRLLDDKARDVAIAAIGALGKTKGKLSKEVLKKALSSKIWEVRAKGVSLLRGREDDWIFEAVRERLLEDKDWHVRAEAVKLLVHIRQKRCVEVLIDALAKEDGRMKNDVWRALVSLTGLKMDAYHKDWKDWWDRNRETFELPEKKEGTELAGGPGQGVREEDQATYYGRKIRSKKVTFLIDFSKSMMEEYIPPGVKGTQVKGNEEKVRKIDVAKRELIQALKKLQPDVLFNVFYFRDVPQPWKPSLQRASKENRKAAIEFIERGKPAGVTNIYDTLERALGDKKVDTIYLLTDGVPTAGKYKQGHLNEFKMAVAELNEHRKVSINTISFGDQTHAYKWFLEVLAEENFGEYLER